MDLWTTLAASLQSKTVSLSLQRLREPNWRAACYIAILVALNCYFAGNLFLAEFTNNMRTNAGSFMAISRFVEQHFPHLGWFPWWFNGEPFENSYTPMLHLIDAAFAWITGFSTPRAFNFVTGFFFIFGPAFLFYFVWRISGYLETSFLAALAYSLFSPCALFPLFRSDLGMWNSWRMRALVFYGEGPHTTVLATLPLALLLVYRALTTRKYLWCAAATVALAFIALVNAFGAVDLLFGCVCVILALPRRELLRASLLTGAMGVAAYLLACPFLTPTLLRTIGEDAQYVGGVVTRSTMFTNQLLILPGFIFLYFALRNVEDFLTRFLALLTYLFFEIVALAALVNVLVLPQPHRYSLEMELFLAPLAALALRRTAIHWPVWLKAAGAVVLLAAAVHQTIAYRRFARLETPTLDVTTTIEYRTAQWFKNNMPHDRAFVGAQTGTWLNVWADTPQMHSGHDPFNPNFWVEEAAAYAIYSDENAAGRGAYYSILWLKAYGCQAIYIPGPNSRVDTRPFNHPRKFDGVLPVLWHEEDDTIYGVPERTRSLGHVVPESALVKRQPIHGLDTDQVALYVAALDDASLPADMMTWPDPNHGHIDTTIHPGQVLSVQETYDKGWIATANGKPAPVTRDAIGLNVVHADCDGACSIDFVFDGGLERKVCRWLSLLTLLGGLAGAVVAFRRRSSQH